MSGDSNEMSHLGLGQVVSKLGLDKRSLMDAVKLGMGSALGITGTDLLLSRILVKDGVPMVPAKWSPAAIAVLGIVGGSLARRFVGAQLATGMIAGTVGLAVSEVVRNFTAPAAVTAPPKADSAALEGFGSGRAFSGSLSGFARLSGGDSSLYGVGTPDVSAARMFNGATVAIEEGGPMAGAAVQIEEAANFAGVLN